MRTSAVTHPMAKATSTAVATREKLGVPSGSEKTPRQKGGVGVVSHMFFSQQPSTGQDVGWRKAHRLKACATYCMRYWTATFPSAGLVVQPAAAVEMERVSVAPAA